MSLVTKGWCRVEGAAVRDTQKSYGYTLTSPIAGDTVFYTRPSVQIYNKTSAVLGVAYKVVSVREITGFTTVQQIDKNYSEFISKLNEYDKTIDIGNETNAAQLYYEEFVVTESSVIFFDDSTRGTFRNYAVVYVDNNLSPPIVGITTKYVGGTVPVGLKFNESDLRVFAEYADGNISRVLDGYTIDPEDITIKNVGVNVFKITFETTEGLTLTSSVNIQGIKRLTGIKGTYDGPSLHKGQTVERRYLIVVALYSDGSSGTVTSYSFPNGNVIGNNTSIDIAYNGEYCSVEIPTYKISTSRLVAYYNGPNIEVDNKNPNSFDITKTIIKIYYESNDGTMSNWEDVSPELCTFTPSIIEREGNNQILVQYTGKNGPVQCFMYVPGFKPSVVMTALSAEYTGPGVVQGKTYSLEKVIVKAYYSDGTVSVIKKGFKVNKNVVEYIGLNRFTCTYTDRPESGEDKTIETSFTVVGLEKDSTTETTYSPISLQNNYPEAVRHNNRYRGPAEGMKHHNMDLQLAQNIREIYNVFAGIEQSYNSAVSLIEGQNSIKYLSVNQINHINDTVTGIMDNDRYREIKGD